MTPTPVQARAVIEVCNAVYEAIEASGEQGIPSGHLYAMLMDKMRLQTYLSIIALLQKSGKITNKGHVLRKAQ